MKEQKITGTKLWIGRIISWIVILFMLFDAVSKFLKPEPVIQVTVNELGYQEHHIVIIGFLGLISTILYGIPRTSILGAIILTAFYGGAVASNLRIDNPLFSHTLFPVYIAILMWLGLWLRDNRLKSILEHKNK
jgi:hypothetical protein